MFTQTSVPMNILTERIKPFNCKRVALSNPCCPTLKASKTASVAGTAALHVVHLVKSFSDLVSQNLAKRNLRHDN